MINEAGRTEEKWTFNWIRTKVVDCGQLERTYDSKEDAEYYRGLEKSALADQLGCDSSELTFMIEKVDAPVYPKPTEHDVVKQDGRWT